MDKVVIIAPHPDDELIGCYKLITSGLVKKIVYVSNSIERINSADKLCRDFDIQFGLVTNLIALHHLDKNDIYLVPSITDHHPLHRQVNGIMKEYKNGYYSIDMNAEFIKELLPNEQQEKHNLLNRYYPDQKALWENDWKYFLFEGTVIEL